MSNRTLSCIKDLRASVVRTLKAANIAGIGQNVFSARQERAWKEESGFICVYTPETNFDDKRTSPRFYFVTGDLVVDVYGRGAVDVPDDSSEIYDVNDFLDDTAKAVADALQPIERRVGPYSGLVKRLVLKSIVNNLSSAGEAERGNQRMVFNVEYAVTITIGGPVDNFVKAENTLTMGSGTGNKIEFDTVVQEVPPTPPAPEPEPEPEPTPEPEPEETEPVENEET